MRFIDIEIANTFVKLAKLASYPQVAQREVRLISWNPRSFVRAHVLSAAHWVPESLNENVFVISVMSF